MDDTDYKYIALVSEREEPLNYIEHAVDISTETNCGILLSMMPSLVRRAYIKFDSNVFVPFKSYGSEEDAIRAALEVMYSRKKVFNSLEYVNALVIRSDGGEDIHTCIIEDIKINPHIFVNLYYVIYDEVCTSDNIDITRNFLNQ